MSLGHRQSGTPMRVVICDDDPAFRYLVRQWLSAAGSVEVAADVATVGDLLPAVESCHPDAVVIDGGVHAESARDPVAEIRRISPSTPIVLVSGMPRWTLEELVAITGADTAVSKADGMDALVEVLRRIAAHRPQDR